MPEGVMDARDRAKAAIVAKSEGYSAPMNIEVVKEELLDWLAHLKFPGAPQAASWEDCLRVYPPRPEDTSLDSGLRPRLGLRLHTRSNEYLLLIIESLDPQSSQVYFVTVHRNWKEHEKAMQRMVREGYGREFDTVLTAGHTIWAQTFRLRELHDALDACTVAMLGYELVNPGNLQAPAESLRPPHPGSLNFPASDKS